MARDRDAVISTKLALRGVIDYSEVDVHDSLWWQRWRILGEAQARDDYVEISRMAYLYQLSLVSSVPRKSVDENVVHKHMMSAFHRLEGGIRPWVSQTDSERAKTEYETFAENWEQMSGIDLNDPDAVAAWEEKLRSELASTRQGREAEQEKMANQYKEFNKRAEEIRMKRMQQQGKVL